MTYRSPDGNYDPSSGMLLSESWLFAQQLLGKPLPTALCKPSNSRSRHESLEWAAKISTRAEEKLRALRQQEMQLTQPHPALKQFVQELLHGVTEWDENQPRVPAGSPDGGQWTGGGVGGGGSSARGERGSSQSHDSSSLSTNADGVEVAGAGPKVSRSYRLKVQVALQTLDPDIARWWKSNSVDGEIRSRAAGWWQSKSRSWLDANGRPVIELDQNLTPGQAAQAIIDEVTGGQFAASIGASFKGYQFARTGDVEEFRNGSRARPRKPRSWPACWPKCTSIQSPR